MKPITYDPTEHGNERRNYIIGTAALVAGAVIPLAVAAGPAPTVSNGNPSTLPILRNETSQDWFEAIPGERMRVRIGRKDTHGALSVTESIVAPKAATPLHYHVADEMFLIVSGRLHLVCGGKGHDLVSGSSAVIPGGAHHGFVNLSVEPVQMLAIFQPGGMEELFIQHQTTRPEKWSELARRFDTVIVGPPVTG